MSHILLTELNLKKIQSSEHFFTYIFLNDNVNARASGFGLSYTQKIENSAQISDFHFIKNDSVPIS